MSPSTRHMRIVPESLRRGATAANIVHTQFDGPTLVHHVNRHRLEVAAGLAAAVAYAPRILRHPAHSEWQTCFVDAARALAAGQPIHDGEYVYPPAMAMLALPFTSLRPAASLLAWYAVNLAATGTVLYYAWQLAGGPLWRRASPRWQAVFWLGLLLVLRFLLASFENHQVDVIIAALLCVGWVALWREHDVRAGVSLGFAAALKGPPLLFLPYLLWRRRWLAASLLAATAALINVLPDILWPQASGRLYLTDWYTCCLLPERWATGQGFTDPTLNQSLAGLFRRALLWGRSPEPTRSAVAAALTWVSAAALIGLTAWRLSASRRAPIAADEHMRHRRDARVPIECAALACLMLLISPQSSKSHYAVLLVPALIAARAIFERPTVWHRALLAGLSLSGPLTAKGLIGKRFGDLTLAWGLPTGFALLLLLAMLVALGAPDARPDAGTPDG